MKSLVWLLYFASLIGLVMSALLANGHVRKLIVAMWIKVRLHKERVSLSQLHKLRQAYLRAYYLNCEDRTSVIKLVILSLVAATISGTAVAVRLQPDARADDFVLIVVRFTLLSLPWHFGIEWAFASLSRYLILRPEPHKHTTLLLSLALPGIIYAVDGVAWLLSIVSNKTNSDWLLYLLMESGPGYTYFFGSEALRPPTTKDLLLHISVLFSMCASGVLIVAILLTSLLRNSRRTHELLARLCVAVSSPSPATLLSSSMLLFTLATGMMQAYSF